MTNFTQGLNPEQTEAVLYDEGSLLVLAGAGSGKTRVITHRFAHLVEKHGLGIHNILCVTFTNKAAGEMKERIGQLLGVAPDTAWVRTFHSMCVRMLRRDADRIGFSKDFTIYDAQDSRNTIKRILERLNINPKEVGDRAAAQAIGRAKEDSLSPEALGAAARDSFGQCLAEVYGEYQRALRANMAMDFSDLINNTLLLLQSSPDVKERYQNLWRYVMADEFQDTNAPQFQLLELLSRNRSNVCVVGDDDQSIYGWRGAKVENIRRFHELFGAHIIRLERNYRSQSHILTAANGIVKSIKGRMPKTLRAQRAEGSKIVLAALGDDRLQAAFVFEELKKLAKGGNYGNFAILYRTNAQSRLLEEVFIRHAVPFRIYGGQKFYDRAEIKDILCYLRLVINPADGAAFERVANVPRRKVGDKSLESLYAYAAANGLDYLQTCLKAAQIPGLSVVAAQALGRWAELWQQWGKDAPESPPADLVKRIINGTGYPAYLIEEHGKEDAENRMENISELINSIKTFEELNPDGSIADFLSEASLLSGGEENPEDARNSVSLMTVHSAKGLEFPTVFVIGLSEGLFPLGNASTDEEINEEKRLFYVAATRAMDKLYLSYGRRSQRYGEWGDSSPSHFLAMIPKEITEERKSEEPAYQGSFGGGYGGGRRYNPTSKSSPYGKRPPVTKPVTLQDLAPEPALKTEAVTSLGQLPEGTPVLHRMFGEGIVEYSSSAMLKVNFKRTGRQVLMGNVLAQIQKIIIG